MNRHITNQIVGSIEMDNDDRLGTIGNFGRVHPIKHLVAAYGYAGQNSIITCLIKPIMDFNPTLAPFIEITKLAQTLFISLTHLFLSNKCAFNPGLFP